VLFDIADARGTILASHSLGANATGTDVSIFSAAHHDWMYVNAAGFMSVHAFKITAPGKFSLFQRYHVSDMPKGTIPTMGFTVSFWMTITHSQSIGSGRLLQVRRLHQNHCAHGHYLHSVDIPNSDVN